MSGRVINNGERCEQCCHQCQTNDTCNVYNCMGFAKDLAMGPTPVSLALRTSSDGQLSLCLICISATFLHGRPFAFPHYILQCMAFPVVCLK